MALDQKFFKKSTAAGSGGDQEQGLFIYADANDVDSYDGDGSIWYDINGHEVNIPLADKASNLKVHLNASDTNSYNGVGTTWTDLTDTGLNATISGPSFGSDTRGYFDFSGAASDLITIPDSSFVDMQSNSTMEVWLQKPTTTCHIINKGAGDGNESYALWATSSTIYFYRYNSGTGSTTGLNISTSSIATDEYMHVAITVGSSGDFKMYLNGGNLVTASLSSYRDNSHGVRIGNYNTSNQHPYTEKLSVVRFYNTALTSAEIGQNYRAGNNLSYSSIITSKHQATQGTLHTNNLQMNLLGSAYSSGATWTDSSGNGNNGAITGTPGYTNEDGDGDYLTFSPGQTSGTGTSSTTRLTVSSFSALQTATAFTIELWLKSSTASSDGMIWNIYDSSSSTRKFSLSWNNSNLRWVVYSASGGYDGSQDLFSTNTFSTNTWLHVTATYNYNTEMKIYVDGVLEGEELSPNFGVNTTTTTQMRIGDRSDGYAVDTQVGQARFYDAALTPAQVTTNYNATKDLYQNPNILTDLRPSNYSSGTTWSDSSTKSNNATLNNFSSTVADYYDQELGDFFDISGNDYFSTSVTRNWASIPFSVEMWFNTDSRNGEYLWGLNESSSMAYGVGASVRGSGNSYHLQFLGSGLIVSAGVVETNRWYHLVFTSDGTTKKAYLDGELKGTGTTTINSAANGKAFIFGRYGTYNGAYFNGKIGHTRVYEGALTAKQVAQNYLATKSKYPNGNNFTLYSPDFKNSSTPYYFRFNAANDEARVSSVDIDVSMGFTVSIYIKRHTAVSGYAQPFRITGTSYPSYLFMIAGLNDSVYYLSSGAGNSLNTYGSSGNWTDNSSTWRNVIFTRENTPGSTTNRGEIYVNGSSHATATNLSAITNITNIYVNRDNGFPTTRNANCDIGLIKIWKKPFSDAEALAEYNATKDIYGL